MRYLILINQNPHAFDGMSDEQLMAFGRRHLALREQLMDSGELIAGEGLANSSQARTVRVRGGQTLTSDGPFAELKEHLAGFYLPSASPGRCEPRFLPTARSPVCSRSCCSPTPAAPRAPGPTALSCT